MRDRIGNRDRNEGEIVRAYELLGGIVVRHGGRGEPDLFVGLRGLWIPIEVKGRAGARGGTSDRELRPEQARFHALARAAGLPIAVARSPEEALAPFGIKLTGGGA